MASFAGLRPHRWGKSSEAGRISGSAPDMTRSLVEDVHEFHHHQSISRGGHVKPFDRRKRKDDDEHNNDRVEF